ncbi:MAG: hypothetical protein NC310_03485 [Roseburia sp.]|nr:hypothetical protein [Anaeroplasma bactoclasticum]MCM1196122.1 hypothetical protein [Roseburia sp.]MCM1555996.1 hypothetical protein [Anaeroplasma bactoclasticum]
MKKIISVFLLVVFFLSLSSCKKTKEEKLLSLELNTPKEITTYVGLAYIPTGITVYAVYETNKEDVTKEATFSSIDTMSLGIKQVFVSYLGLQVDYQVEVISKPHQPSYSLVITHEPYKTTYYVNEAFESNGLELAFLEDNAYQRSISLLECEISLSFNGITKDKLDEAGLYRIIITYRYNQTTYVANQYIEVLHDLNSTTNDKLVVDKEKSKLTYYLNEPFEKEQIYVSIKDTITNTNVPIQSTLCSFSLFYNAIPVEEFTETGTYVLLIQYENIECEALIEVLYRVIQKELELSIDDAILKFSVGEAFSSQGLVIYYCEDGIRKRVVNRLSCNFTFYLNGILKEQFDEPGTYSVVVEFEGITEGYKIAVLD